MQNIFIDVLPPWVETGLQPAFYDLESGTVLQQTARMYAKVRELTEAFNTFSENVTNEVNTFEQNVNDEIERFEDSVNDTVEEYIEKFNDLHDYVEDYFDNLDVQEEINNKLDAMVEDGTLEEIANKYFRNIVITPIQFGATGDGTTNDTQALQDAIDYAIAHGVKLFIPAGTYLVSKLTINGYITLEGNGFDTLIKSIDNNSETSIVYVVNNGLYKSEISNFRIDGNKDNNSEVINGLVLYVDSATYRGDKYTNIHDISIYNCTGSGIYSNGNGGASSIREIRVTNLDVAGCNVHGFEMRAGTDSIYLNCVAHSNKQHGFFFGGGNCKITDCKAFYNGQGDGTTIEEANRIPANAFTATADVTPQAGKTYYTRSGAGSANSWYEFAVFSGSTFDGGTTYYELTTTYYKRYAGFNCSGARCLYTSCESQENYGDGFIVYSSDQAFSNILADNNGLLTSNGSPVSYASQGLTQLYYGIYDRCYRLSVYGHFCNYSKSTYGSSQKAPIMVWKVNQIKGNIYSTDNLDNVLYTQGTNLNQVKLFVNEQEFRYQFSGTITPTADLTMQRTNLWKIGNIVYVDLIIKDDNGQIIPTTSERVLCTLPNNFKPIASTPEILNIAYVSSNGGYDIKGTCSLRITPDGQISIRNNPAITNHNYVLIRTSFIARD